MVPQPHDDRCCPDVRNPLNFARSLRATVTEQDRNVPIPAFMMMSEVITCSVARPKSTMAPMGFFAGTAFFLTARGLFVVE
ncbi:MAG: hypothetical protein M2R45_01351 [Verrucomicrobia subdivision 3 bacterium]|nr:hypothetical protein [Limisphaerales bacterium]MCS1416030.1 hypothetical protein [Limisphaerales bacterium]